MNGIGASVERRVDFIHIPAPKNAGDAFFAPLADWRSLAGTHLYLGLLQHDDRLVPRRE